MPEYKVPLDDIRFAMNEVLDFPGHYAAFGFEEATPDMVDAILEEAASFVESEVAPLHQIGDEHGCQWNDGEVSTPPGFKAAYKLYCENGWAGLAQPEEDGGQGLPSSLGTVVMEMIQTANHPWAMYPVLSLGAINTTREYAPDELKSRVLPPMIEGRWTGTMCLTEANAGSDLGLLRTKAKPNADGTYAISGTKVFISSGEHDLAENIIHIVLARLPDAPPGIKGISLFLVPKFNINDDGSLGERNDVTCGSIENKMGIHGNATCVLNFDGARGYLLGEAHKGMRQMFTFINESRLVVAQCAQGAVELSFQGAIAYARERLQMRAPVRKLPDKPADPIIVHPDIRRMLLTQKALSEGGRLLNMFCAQQVDREYFGSKEDRAAARSLLALLTPIAKGFLTEIANEATSYGIQVFGGHGYISEWGMEQIVRDVRITALYEGTTGIQGLDLLGRKILATEGKLLEPFLELVNEFIDQDIHGDEIKPLVKALAGIADEWVNLTQEIGERAMQDPDEVNAAAYDYLMFSGYAVMAYFLARFAAAAIATDDSEFHRAKVDVARFYFERLLPRTQTLAATIRAGAASIAELR